MIVRWRRQRRQTKRELIGKSSLRSRRLTIFDKQRFQFNHNSSCKSLCKCKYVSSHLTKTTDTAETPVTIPTNVARDQRFRKVYNFIQKSWQDFLCNDNDTSRKMWVISAQIWWLLKLKTRMNEWRRRRFTSCSFFNLNVIWSITDSDIACMYQAADSPWWGTSTRHFLLFIWLRKRNEMRNVDKPLICYRNFVFCS